MFAVVVGMLFPAERAPAPIPGCNCTNQLGSFTNYPGCVDQFPTAAVFKITYLSSLFPAPVNITVAGLADPGTAVGRSAPFNSVTELSQLGDPIECATNFPGTSTNVFDQSCFVPAGFPSESGNPLRREVDTEILSLALTNDATPIVFEIVGVTNFSFSAPGAVTIHAGAPYYLDTLTNGEAVFYNNSYGEVASLCCGTPVNLLADFPAESYFAVYVDVNVNIPGLLSTSLHNRSPLVLSSELTQFPPNFALPMSTYIHDPAFGAVPLYDTNGYLTAYLLSAGHGGSTNVATPPPDAPFLNRFPVCFGVTAPPLCNTNTTPPATNPNDASANPLPADRATSIYLSSGLDPGSVPDGSNIRVPNLPPSAGFATNDALKSFSFGRDGTGNIFNPNWCLSNGISGILFFSVSCSSQGVSCSDVALNALNPGAAADVYATGIVAGFGLYTNPPAPLLAPSNNVLAVDAQQLGLAPGDNVTGLQMKLFNDNTNDPNHDFLYLTMAGPSFSNQSAVIFTFDPTNSVFSPTNLAVFAAPGAMGLTSNDVIEALAVSDLTPGACPQHPNRTLDASLDEALFSLAPGSYSLTNNSLGMTLSAADILYTKFNGSFRIFANYSALGLLSSDAVDALDIEPGMPLQLTCTVEPPVLIVDAGGSATFTAVPVGLPPLSAQWFSNGVPITGATNLSYSIPSVVETGFDTSYTITVSNAYSVASATGILDVPCGLLTAQLAASNFVVLTWPAFSPCVLQQSASLSPTNWSNIPTNLYTVTNGNHFWSTTASNSAQFYRLSQ